MSNINQKSKKENLSKIGQIWPDLLVPFSNDYKIKLTASEIAKKSEISRRSVSRMLNRLVENNMLRYNMKGKNKEYYIDLEDPKSKILIQIAESMDSLRFTLNNKPIFILISEMLKLREIVLFGSYAKGNATKDSDIDIFVIGKESEKIKKYVRNQTKEINLHFSTIKEFEKLLKKKHTLAIEIVKNHIIFGGSQFIELCWRYYKNEL